MALSLFGKIKREMKRNSLTYDDIAELANSSEYDIELCCKNIGRYLTSDDDEKSDLAYLVCDILNIEV